MPIPTTTDLTDEPNTDLVMVNGLIARKEAGEPVDGDILALLTDMERVGLTDTEAYVALDAYRPGSVEGATGGDDDAARTAEM
ncbi:hypothetical protein MCBMB27_02629 [Methylobacterium phyllosphaerae]|uniref:Uncharacterized protein n=1 Tax=Methylobacterium phyllosphaerae TaxID=418223 RepID=A0AAE8HSI2_9HYPH|nr:hypothetical protein [Methylobacterium phyllosphaerae]APT31920.1 hypothetical protein MCBMB27_02629 [Methylobacterium phyllosphaerae]SFH01554.1 hypothetical protein SAMN05192567_11238 [Methylobacterium phyllosphaerae]